MSGHHDRIGFGFLSKRWTSSKKPTGSGKIKENADTHDKAIIPLGTIFMTSSIKVNNEHRYQIKPIRVKQVWLRGSIELAVGRVLRFKTKSSSRQVT